MFGEGFDMNALLQQAQAMQEQLQQAQAEAASKSYTASAGGDLVTATMSGTGELTGLVISPEACDPDDTEGLADLIIAAVRAAKAQADAGAMEGMPQMPDLGQLGL